MQNAGVVTFHRLSDDTTRMMLQLDVEPEGLDEQVGDKLGHPLAPRRRRPRAVQALHRGSRRRDRRLARRGAKRHHDVM